jgi:hypothetical protein
MVLAIGIRPNFIDGESLFLSPFIFLIIYNFKFIVRLFFLLANVKVKNIQTKSLTRIVKSSHGLKFLNIHDESLKYFH